MSDLLAALRKLFRQPALLIPGALAAFTLGSGSLANLLRALIERRRTSLLPGTQSLPPAVMQGVAQAAQQAGQQAPPDPGGLMILLLALLLLITVLLLAMLLFGAAIGLAAIALMARAGERSARDAAFQLNEAINLSIQRMGRLLLLASLPGIPLLITLILSVLIAGISLGMNVPRGDLEALRAALIGGGALWRALALLNLPGLLILIGMTLLQGLALRAALFEDRSALDSFRRAWALIRQRPGEYLSVQVAQLTLQGLIIALLIGLGLLPVLRWLASPIALLLNAAARALYALSWSGVWVRWTSSEAAE